MVKGIKGFQKGYIPHNKGQKGYKNKGSFKKGYIPWSKKNKGKYHIWKNKECPSKGKIPWNKGLTKETDERIRISSLNHKGKNGKNGIKHTEETKKKMRLSAIRYIIKTCNNISPRVGTNEKQILDKLEHQIGYKIIRQYEVDGYFLDGYIKELNLAIEVDERPKNKLKDVERENNIINKLGCKFMRINDFD